MAPDAPDNDLKRIGDILRSSVSSQVSEYQSRFRSIDNLHEPFLSNLIRTDFNPKRTPDLAQAFFGKKCVAFAGIDGTMYTNPMFDLIVFYGGSFASRARDARAEATETRKS